MGAHDDTVACVQAGVHQASQRHPKIDCPTERVTIEWTAEEYTRYRITVPKTMWQAAVDEDRADEFLGNLEAEELAREYDHGVTARHAYINGEEVL